MSVRTHNFNRALWRVIAVLGCWAALNGRVAAQPGALDRSFYPGSAMDGSIYAVALQADGGLFVGGDFSLADSGVRYRIARLTAEGRLEASFGAGLGGADATVRAVAVQSDGKVLIGGDFRHVNNLGTNWLARLNADGSLDPSFGAPLTGPVYTIALQSDGKILVGGNFSTLGVVLRRGLARLNSNGTVDAGFDTGLVYPSTVYSLALQTNGQVLLGGSFSQFSGGYRTNLARVQSNGALDTGFTANVNGLVNCLTPQGDGRLLAGGYFTTLNGVPQNGLARLNTNGSLDSGFTQPFNRSATSVSAIALCGNGQLLVLGQLYAAGAALAHNLARLNSDGSWDSTFGYTDLYQARALALSPDGTAVVAGGFYSVNGITRLRIARLTTTGAVDLSFNSQSPGPSGPLGAVVALEDRRVLINGGPPTRESVRPCGIARLNEDGSFDSTFALYGASELYAGTRCLVVQPDSHIILAGIFSAVVNGQARNNIARLLPDGQLDASFNCTVINNEVYSVALQSDGKLVVGGQFGQVLRLNSNGSLDGSFATTNYVSSVYCLALQPDGKVLIGGSFSQVGAAPRNNIARLNRDGTLDTSFGNGLAGANADVLCLALQPDAKVLIGGAFHRVNGTNCNGIARLNSDGSWDNSFGFNLQGTDNSVECLALQPDGKILIGGLFYSVNFVPRTHFARLNADGSTDTNLVDVPFGNYVGALATTSDGKVLAGGGFTSIGSLGQAYVARLYGDRPPLSLIRTDPQTGRLVWPAGWEGFTAEQSSPLNTGWSPVQPAAASDGTNWSVTVPTTNGQQFFRLRKL